MQCKGFTDINDFQTVPLDLYNQFPKIYSIQSIISMDYNFYKNVDMSTLLLELSIGYNSIL